MAVPRFTSTASCNLATMLCFTAEDLQRTRNGPLRQKPQGTWKNPTKTERYYSHGVVKKSVHRYDRRRLGIRVCPGNLYQEGFGITIFTYLKEREILGLETVTLRQNITLWSLRWWILPGAHSQVRNVSLRSAGPQAEAQWGWARALSPRLFQQL